uniref:Apolipoprotein C-III n=1 Tax=Capra hircus TaxID=9925 RepID=A0A452EAP5_CAPHI
MQPRLLLGTGLGAGTGAALLIEATKAEEGSLLDKMKGYVKEATTTAKDVVQKTRYALTSPDWMTESFSSLKDYWSSDIRESASNPTQSPP